MKISQSLLGCFASAAFLCSASVAAEPDPTVKGEPAAPAQAEAAINVSEVARRSITANADGYLRQVFKILDRHGKDGVATAETIAAQKRFMHAGLRANVLATLLRMDLDGDGNITAEERDLLNSPPFMGKGHMRLLAEVSRASGTDANETLTFAEMSQFAEQKAASELRRQHELDPYHLPMFDRDGDGMINKKEVAATVDAVSRQVKMEAAAHRARGIATASPPCAAPVPSSEVETVILSGYEGDGISTVHVGGPDRTTTVANLDIFEGEKPLYILVTSYDAIIWRLQGAVERVEKFVVQKGHAPHGDGVGVVGLDPGVVAFLPKKACIPMFTSPEDGDALLAEGRMETHWGRNVDHVLAQRTLDTMQIPSGSTKPRADTESRGPIVDMGDRRFELTPDGPRLLPHGGPDSDLLRYHPGGIVDLEPSEVVAPVPAASYDILPQEAGLLQLLEDGAIRRTKDGSYVIEKELAHLPAGLRDGKFILPDGMPVPAGNPGHAVVIRQSTGECVSGMWCAMMGGRAGTVSQPRAIR